MGAVRLLALVVSLSLQCNSVLHKHSLPCRHLRAVQSNFRASILRKVLIMDLEHPAAAKKPSLCLNTARLRPKPFEQDVQLIFYRLQANTRPAM